MPLDDNFWKMYSPQRFDLLNSKREITSKLNLEEYIHLLRSCTDEREILTEYLIYDNFDIHLYDEMPEILYQRIHNEFESSPQGSLINSEWEKRKSNNYYQFMNSPSGSTHLVQIQQGKYDRTRQDEQVFVCFHPVEGKEELTDTDWLSFTSAILSFLDYVILEKIPCHLIKPAIIHSP